MLLKKQFISISKKSLKFVIVVLFLSFLALPFIRNYSENKPDAFLKNNFSINTISEDAEVNEIYDVSILPGSIEPETMYLYAGDVVRFNNSSSVPVSIKISSVNIDLDPGKDYFNIFNMKGTYNIKVASPENSNLDLELDVHVK